MFTHLHLLTSRTVTVKAWVEKLLRVFRLRTIWGSFLYLLIQLKHLMIEPFSVDRFVPFYRFQGFCAWDFLAFRTGRRYGPSDVSFASVAVTFATALVASPNTNGSLLERLSHHRSGMSTQPPSKPGILPS